MRATFVLFAASMAFAQDATRVFQLHHIETPQAIQQFATTVRTMADIPQLTADVAQKTISLTGTPAQVAIAEFLYTELDRQTVPDSVSQDFKVPSKDDDVVHLFFLTHTPNVQAFQEVATTVRTIAEIRRVFTYEPQNALILRGTADQIAAAGFLVHELDQPADPKRTTSRLQQMIDTGNHGETAVQVFYLPYTATVQQFQEVATVIRTIGEVRRIFTYNANRAMIIRGTADQVAFTSWMASELGKPVVPGTASTTYQYAGNDRNGENLIRVFYVKDTPTVAAFQQLATQIRTNTKMRRVFTYNESKALALRGNEAQLATAEQMLQDRQVALK